MTNIAWRMSPLVYLKRQAKFFLIGWQFGQKKIKMREFIHVYCLTVFLFVFLFSLLNVVFKCRTVFSSKKQLQNIFGKKVTALILFNGILVVNVVDVVVAVVVSFAVVLLYKARLF